MLDTCINARATMTNHQTSERMHKGNRSADNVSTKFTREKKKGL